MYRTLSGYWPEHDMDGVPAQRPEDCPTFCMCGMLAVEGREGFCQKHYDAGARAVGVEIQVNAAICKDRMIVRRDEKDNQAHRIDADGFLQFV